MRETAANVEMQGIEFQIVNDSAEASRGLDVLAKSLANLKNSLGTGGSAMSRLAKNITNIKTAVAGLNTSKITELGNALNAFGNATASLSISSSIGNQVQKIANAVTAIPDSTSQKLNDLATSLKPLTELGKQQLGSFITQLKKIPELVTELETADMSKFKHQMQDLANAMKPFADEMQKVSSGFSALPSRIQKLITSTEQYNNTARKATNHTTAWSKALKKISLVAIFRSGYKLLASAINKSAEYTETLNMFTVSMGEYAQEAYEYAQTVAEVLSIDPSTWMENQGVFNSIITGFGVASDKASTMSKNLTQLAYDLSSFYNIGIEESMQKVQSGISGELEPLRRLGYDLSVARLQQEALNLGIEKSVSDMTQAEKAQLRYYAMMTQVTQVQGDMARTLEEPANQLRVLKAQVEQAARAFGNIFIPVLNAVLPVVIAVVSAVRELLSALASLFGVNIADSVDWEDSIGSATDGTGDIADNMDSAASAADKLKKTLASFDELNILTDETSSGGSSSSGSGSGSSFDLDPIDYDFLGDAVTEKIDKIKASLEPVVSWLKENMESILTIVLSIGNGLLAWKITQSVIEKIKEVVDFFKNGAKNLDKWQTALQKIGGLILIAVGVTLSYDASYDIGYGTAGIMSYIEEALGVIAATVGGYLVFGPAGAVIGFTLSIIASVAGYFEGAFDAEAVENFSRALSTGGTSFTEYAQAATEAMKELDGVNGIVAGYAQSLTEIDEKINSSKLALENYITKWNETGTASKEEIQGIIDELQNLVEASQEKLDLASQILETTLVEAIKNAGVEAEATYRELLGMIYLLESQGNRTLAEWKTELAMAENELRSLDETSETYEEDAAALMETITDLVFKIAGIGDTSVDVTKDLKNLGTTVGNLDFSDMLENPEVAMQALEDLTAATEEAYTNAYSAYQGQLEALDELFAYVDTSSVEWAAVYQRSLQLGLDPETAFDDVDAVKEFFAGYFKDIYQSNVEEIDKLATEIYGTIAESLGDAMEEAMAESKEFAVDEFGNLWSWADAADPDSVALSPESFEKYKKTFIKSFRTDEVIDGLIDAFDDSFSRIKSSATMAGAAAGFTEPFETGVRDWSESVNMDDVAEKVTEKFGASFKKFETSYIEASDPVGSILGIFDISWDDVGDAISNGWDTVKDAVSDGWDWIKDKGHDFGEWIEDTWEGFIPSLGTKIFHAADTTVVETAQKITEGAKTTAENQDYGVISKAIKGGFDASVKLEDFAETGSRLVSDVAEGITPQTSNKSSGFLSSALSDVASAAASLVTDVFGIGTQSAMFRSKGENMIEDMAEGLVDGTSELEAALEKINHTVFSTSDAYDSGYSFGTSLGDGISKALKNYSFPTLSGNITTSNNGTASIKFKAYAEGGFVDAGQLFVAREAGAEMVGTIGGHTAVANNDQIENAISNAVYRAMVSAMSNTDGGGNSRGGTQVVTAKVNEKTLFEVVLDYARREAVRTGKNRLIEI